MNRRSERLSASIQRAVAQELQQDFPGRYVTVTEVEVAPDAKFAIIWISILEANGRDKLFAQIEAKRGQLRTAITHEVQLRRVPNIELRLDLRAERAQLLDRLTRGKGPDAN